MNTPDPIDLNSVHQWWRLVYVPGHCVELRVIAPQGAVASGYFDDEAEFTKAIEHLNGRAQLYTTLNPVPLAFMGRGANVMRGSWKAEKAGLATVQVDRVSTTQDTDIELERIVFLDVDPVRPSDTASTENELSLASAVADKIRQYLSDLGCAAIIGMSGNGWYILLVVPTTEFTDDKIALRGALLKHLSDRFDTPDAHVDVKVGNPARIAKVLGTLSIKGANVPEYGRPHRVSRLVSDLTAPVDLYGALGDELHLAEPNDQLPGRRGMGAPLNLSDSGCRYNIVALLEGAGLSFRRKDRGDAELYELEKCPVSDDHQAWEACVIVNRATGVVAFKCHHNGGGDWDWKRFKTWLRALGIDSQRCLHSTSGSISMEEETSTEGRPAIILPGGGAATTLSETASKLGRSLGPQRTVFLRENGASAESVQFLDTHHRLHRMTAERFCSAVEEVVQLRKRAFTKTGEICEAVAVCSIDLAKKVLAAPVFQNELPIISLVTKCPVIVDNGNTTRIITGYDAQMGIFARGREVHQLGLKEAVGYLQLLVSETDFVTAADRSRYLAGIITPALIHGRILQARAPILLIEADDRQAGKGYLQRIAAGVYRDKIETVNQQRGGVGSLEESFSQAVLAGAAFISLDNLVPMRQGVFDSPKICSFMTEDTFGARVPHRGTIFVDPSRTIVMATTNGCTLSVDLAKRCNGVRIRKRRHHQYRKFPEGDLLDHVKVNQHLFLGAVFTIIKEWVRQDKPSTDVLSHDSSFNAWAQALDWIIQHIIGEAPLLEGWEHTGERLKSPDLMWLRTVAQAVNAVGSCNQWLIASELLEICVSQGVEVPVEGVIESVEALGDSNRATVLKQIGARLSRCFKFNGGDQGFLEVDATRVERSENERESTHKYDGGTKNRSLNAYRFTRLPEGVAPEQPAAPSTQPQRTKETPSKNQAEPTEPGNPTIAQADAFMSPRTKHPSLGPPADSWDYRVNASPPPPTSLPPPPLPPEPSNTPTNASESQFELFQMQPPHREDS